MHRGEVRHAQIIDDEFIHVMANFMKEVLVQWFSKAVIKLDFYEVGCFLVKLIDLVICREGLRTNH